MNRHLEEGRWRQLRGKVKAEWADLTDDDLKQVAGNYAQLVGKIQEKYGQAREEIEQQLAHLRE